MNVPSIKDVQTSIGARTQAATAAVRNIDFKGIASATFSAIREAFTGDAFGPHVLPTCGDDNKFSFFVQNAALAGCAVWNPLIPGVLAVMDSVEGFGPPGPKKNAAIRLITTAVLTTGLFFAVGPLVALAGVVPKAVADFRNVYLQSPAKAE